MSPTLGSRFWLLAFRKRVEDLLRGCRSEVLLRRHARYDEYSVPQPGVRGTYIEVIADNHHRSIAACALAFNLDDSKFPILRRVTDMDAAEMLADCVEDFRGATEHAGRGGADLHEIISDRLSDMVSIAANAKREHERIAHRLNMV